MAPTSKGIWTMEGIQVALFSAHVCKSTFSRILWVQRARELGAKNRRRSLFGPSKPLSMKTSSTVEPALRGTNINLPFDLHFSQQWTTNKMGKTHWLFCLANGRSELMWPSLRISKKKTYIHRW